MNKNVLTVPAGVRYLSDWARLENGYHLCDRPYPHIIDKQITGCGFTEYCISDPFTNVILCSPRKILLENKKMQHFDEINVIYFKNESEQSSDFDKDITNSGNKSVSKVESSVETLAKEEREKKECEDVKNRSEEYLLKIKQDFFHQVVKLCSSGAVVKVLVTYDSFRHVKEILKSLNIFDSFYVVVDEFQSVFIDSRFKSDTEIELLNELRDVQRLCYVSATPMLEKYLEMLDEFKDLPYFKLDWATECPGRVSHPEINARGCRSLLSEIKSVINQYKLGDFEQFTYRDENGEFVNLVSNEAVIYVNSVKDICSIIKGCGLTLDETNVLCSRSTDNEKKIRQAFRVSMNLKRIDEPVLGHVPVRDEPHKMFTLCTRTVYLGADFYSTCARTYILSDANIDCLSVDISLDLPQILGRQRLDCNPWKNRATLFYKTIRGDKEMTYKDFEEILRKKEENTNNLLHLYDLASSQDQRDVYANKLLSGTKSEHYKSDYVSVNKHAGSGLIPVFNKLIKVADIRTFDIQQVDYKDRVNVLRSISENFRVNEDSLADALNYFNSITQFPERLKFVCEESHSLDESTFMNFLEQIPIIYGCYFNILGEDRLRSLNFQKYLVSAEFDAVTKERRHDIVSEIEATFIVGEKYPLSDIKQSLRDIYDRFLLNKTPKASDLNEYFITRPCTIYLTMEGGPKKKTNGFEILAIKF